MNKKLAEAKAKSVSLTASSAGKHHWKGTTAFSCARSAVPKTGASAHHDLPDKRLNKMCWSDTSPKAWRELPPNEAGTKTNENITADALDESAQSAASLKMKFA